MKKPSEIRKDYNHFIAGIPAMMDKWKTIINTALLTYSPNEIDMVEKVYRANMMHPENIGLSTGELDKMYAAYLGTAYLWHFGGNWYFDSYKLSYQYGEACIENYGGKGFPWVSVSMDGWVSMTRTGQMDHQSMKYFFRKKISYHKLHPEFVLEPVRNIQ